MGAFYNYQCSKCGFKHKYSIGGGYFTEDYYKESQRLELELKEEIAAGKYGPILKAMIDADQEGYLDFSCETELFQCQDCKALLVHREKHIAIWEDMDGETPYKLDVEINQKCPECGSEDFEKLEDKLGRHAPVCPKCKSAVLELADIGLWD